VKIFSALLTAAVALTNACYSCGAEKTVVIPKGETAVAKCVGVHDGDSMTLLLETPEGKRQAKIRLDAIDAPELGQPFATRSKQCLSGKVFGKECAVESLGADKYGRTIGRVTVDGKDVNAEMLEAGMAWHFAKYDSRKEMADRQEDAKKRSVGLWSGDNPIPPWNWRKMPKEERDRHRETVGK
jgi:endonuclease YncB( thermonuclease family)